jgi:hypothetical protein
MCTGQSHDLRIIRLFYAAYVKKHNETRFVWNEVMLSGMELETKPVNELKLFLYKVFSSDVSH